MITRLIMGQLPGLSLNLILDSKVNPSVKNLPHIQLLKPNNVLKNKGSFYFFLSLFFFSFFKKYAMENAFI